MEITQNIQLRSLNTFGVEAVARYFVEFADVSDIRDFVRQDLKQFNRFFILGGGSNILFTQDFDGIVLAVRNKGISTDETVGGKVMITAQAGESWDDLVNYSVGRGFGGIENLALIPGNAGSSPIQNIGAYGVEIKDVFHHLNAIMLETGEERTFHKKSCRFGYRDSIFKRELKGKALITSVTLLLQLNGPVNLRYDALKTEMERRGIANPSVAMVRDAVREVRTSKLPDPAFLGNAGSFFKNPSVSSIEFQRLVNQYPDLHYFLQEDGTCKLAAGWMIEQCGWKGKRLGDAAVHDRQALVIVNHGKATGLQILDLGKKVAESVMERFGVELEREVNVV
ncbi:MAG: UDP-N-acetylmuramate dehydrogenase [Bacteroidetes bacterium]|nr:UDP-N-acetylmuramate dehydrogenase [Bacteroidota bacterium]